MFVQTAHYIEKHKAQGKQMNLRAYGVEKTGAKTYLDLKKRKDLGEKVDSSDINDDEGLKSCRKNYYKLNIL